MEQEQIARHQEILDLCVAARDVLGHLPAPDAATRKAYFSDENLWSLETDTVCGLVHEYYAGVLACIEQQLTFSAAALTRCVHEVCFRFKYLVEHEGELRDWEEWQLAQDYHLLKASLEHDVGVMIPDGDGELLAHAKGEDGGHRGPAGRSTTAATASLALNEPDLRQPCGCGNAT